jgi:hypothetical protein
VQVAGQSQAAAAIPLQEAPLGPVALFSFLEVGDLPDVLGHQFVYVT